MFSCIIIAVKMMMTTTASPSPRCQVLAELHTLRLLTGEKEKEVDMLNDKIRSVAGPTAGYHGCRN